MVICLERGADLHMVQPMPLPLTVSCFSKIQIGFTFRVLAHPSSPGQRAIKRVCVCVLKEIRTKENWFLFFCLTVYVVKWYTLCRIYADLNLASVQLGRPGVRAHLMQLVLEVGWRAVSTEQRALEAVDGATARVVAQRRRRLDTTNEVK